MKVDAYRNAHYNNFDSRAIDLKCFWEVCGNNCIKCQPASAQLLNINLLMSKDLNTDEYLYSTG